MAKCTKKHIENPIPDKEWLCPNCGADADHFYIDVADMEDDCELSHKDDVAVCMRCQRAWKLPALIKLWAKKHNMIKCPHCKGTGWVDQPTDYVDPEKSAKKCR